VGFSYQTTPRLTSSVVIASKIFTIGLPVLIAFSTILIFYNLGSNSIHGVDEARYALVSNEMLVNANWITPYIGETPYFRKPPPAVLADGSFVLFLWNF
jgi:4-amino-4-deoxy-L-arabinose transferase-like glycosyltransferase